MSGPIFMYRNDLSGYSMVADSLSEIYPIENVLDVRLSKKWKGTDDASQRIVIDCGAAVAPEGIAILGHNLEVQTVTIEADASNAWGAPSFSQAVPIKDIIWYLYTGTAYRYWSILIEGNDADNMPEIGYVHFGNALQMSPELSRDLSRTRHETGPSEDSEQGSPFSYDGVELFNYKLSFPYVGEANYVLLDSMFAAIHRRPFLTIFDITDTYYSLRPFWGKIDGDIQEDYVEQDHNWAISFGLQETK